MANYYSTALGDYIGNVFQTSFTGSTNSTLTNIQENGSSLVYVSYSIGTKEPGCGYTQSDIDISTILQPLAGEHLYTSPTNATTDYTFTVPANVYSICVLCIGGTGTNSRSYIVNSSWFGGSSVSPVVSGTTGVICYAGGGSGSGSGGGTGNEFSPNSDNTYITITRPYGGTYYNGGAGSGAAAGRAGGGCAGYAGAGGAGGTTGTAGTGGSGGGGSTSRGGGGIGLYGQGANGAAGGGGGSGGTSTTNTNGGVYGGGFGSTTNFGGGGGSLNYINNFSVTPGATYAVHVGNAGVINSGSSGRGGSGAVRIIWGSGRAFPSTAVGIYNQALN
jgi:hypothetical protein